MSLELELKRAKCQRLVGLKNAFKTLDAFVIPSVDPDTCENYENLKRDLEKRYSDGLTDEDLEDYSFIK